MPYSTQHAEKAISAISINPSLPPIVSKKNSVGIEKERERERESMYMCG